MPKSSSTWLAELRDLVYETPSPANWRALAAQLRSCPHPSDLEMGLDYVRRHRGPGFRGLMPGQQLALKEAGLLDTAYEFQACAATRYVDWSAACGVSTLREAGAFALFEVFGPEQPARLCLAELLGSVERSLGEPAFAGQVPSTEVTGPFWAEGLGDAFGSFSAVIDRYAGESLGACATAIRLTHRGVAQIAHIGDIRVVLYRDGALTHLTRDHTLANDDRYRQIPDEGWPAVSLETILTRTIGDAEGSVPDFCEVRLQPGDVLLAFGRGVYAALDDATICEAVERSGPDKVSAIDSLLKWAEHEWVADISVLLLHVLDSPS